MRPLEIAIPLLLMLYLCWPLISRRRPAALGILPTFILVIMLTHQRIEGLRWQMIPLYAFTVTVFFWTLPAYLRARGEGEPLARPTGYKLLGLIAALGLLTVSTALPALLPVPSLPAPRGPYAIGTFTRLLVDQSRREIYSGQDEPRKLVMQVWYPAEPPAPEAKPTAWMPEANIVAPEIAEYIGLPRFFLNHLAYAKSSAYENLAPAQEGGPYPVLVFVHGWNGFRQQTTFIMQELASHGYIVASLDLPYGARMVVFPDGSVARNNPQALPPSSNLPQDEYEAVARKLVEQWSADIDYTLNALEKMSVNPAEPLNGLLNLDKIGIFGHSTGGGATIQFCGTDSRCTAGLTYDAFMRPVSVEVLENGTSQPFLYLFSELWPFARNTELFNGYYRHVPPTNRVVTILGADHYDFTDLPALSPLAPQLGLKGPINGAQVQKILMDYTLAFFDLTLKGKPTPLLDGPSAQYPEVRFEE
ncbi:MAG: carboxylic ester hydrolase [Anaerolineales bacterium]